MSKKAKKENVIIEETWWSSHYDNFALPETSALEGDNLTREDVATGTKQITKHTKQAIVEEMSRERTVYMMLENIYQRNPEDPVTSIKQFIADCREKSKNIYHELFAEPTPTGETILENDALARELLNHCLGTRGQEKWFTQTQRTELKELLFELNSDADEGDILSSLMSLMPKSLYGVNKIDLMSKVSILLLLLANSHPEKFAKMDEFFEKQVLIDAMVSGKTFSEAIEEILSYAAAFEAKNAGQIYNYRVDNLFQFARAAQEWLAKISDELIFTSFFTSPVKEWLAKTSEFLWKTPLTDALKKQRAKENNPELSIFQDWYRYVQHNMILFSIPWKTPEDNYLKYMLFTKMYLTKKDEQIREDDFFPYLHDLYDKKITDWSERAKNNISLLLSVLFENGDLKMSDYTKIAQCFPDDVKHEIENSCFLRAWSSQAIKLAEKSNGRIMLRIDGKIDFYNEHGEMICKWVAKLKVKWPSDPKNGLMQWDYKDSNGNKWVPWISYMNWDRAVEELKKQELKLFSESEVDSKIWVFLATLGKDWAEQTHALQILFWAQFSRYWHLDIKKWNFLRSPSLGVDSYLAISIYSDRTVLIIKFNASSVRIHYKHPGRALPFLSFEEC
jgi:hypothetical protein